MTDARILIALDGGRCPECHAVLPPGKDRCWLCQRSVTPSVGINPYASPAVGEYSYSLSSLLVVVTFTAVICGLFVIAPGFAILAVVLATPALVRTMLVVRRRTRQGSRPTTSTKVSLFVMSMGVTYVLLVVVSVVAFGTFFVSCLGGIMLSDALNRQPKSSIVLFASFCSLIVTGGMIALLAKWVAHRWRRDTEV